MTFDCLGVVKSYNPRSNELTVKLSFADENLHRNLEEVIDSQEVMKLRLFKNRSKNHTYDQLKRIHAMYKAIILSVGMEPDQSTMEEIEAYCRSKFYPKKQIHSSFFDGILEEPIRLSEQTVDELNQTMRCIENAYPDIFLHNEGWYGQFS